MPAMWEELTKFEREAAAIKNYELAIVPGLLQTPEYARALIVGANEELSPEELETQVEHRMNRQASWRRPGGPPLHVIVDENVCRRLVGSAKVMYWQLRHLVEVTRQSKLTVQVMPSTAGAHPGMEGPFMLLEFDEQPDLVYIEDRCSGAFLEAHEHVSATGRVFRRLRQRALAPEDSVDLVASIADEMA